MTSEERVYHSWPKMMERTGMAMQNIFADNNLAFMNCLGNNTSVTGILNWCYSSLVLTKKVTPIESIPVSEKNRLFEIVKEFTPPLAEKDHIIRCCRALHALEYYLKNRNDTNTSLAGRD